MSMMKAEQVSLTTCVLKGGQLLQGHHIDVRIKWPNDLYGAGLKLGGVLCQSAYREARFHVVIGAGLNLANAQPTTCVDALVAARHAQLGLPGDAAPVQPEVLAPL
jgi:biotin--protein ligase